MSCQGRAAAAVPPARQARRSAAARLHCTSAIFGQIRGFRTLPPSPTACNTSYVGQNRHLVIRRAALCGRHAQRRPECCCQRARRFIGATLPNISCYSSCVKASGGANMAELDLGRLQAELRELEGQRREVRACCV